MVVVEVVLNLVEVVGLATIFVKAPSSEPGRTLLIRMCPIGLDVVVETFLLVTRPKSPLT